MHKTLTSTSKLSHTLQVTNAEFLRLQHSQSLQVWNIAVLSSYGFGFSSHPKTHLKLPVPLKLPFTSQHFSRILSDACSEKLSKRCWIDPCCNLSKSREFTHNCVCHSGTEGLCSVGTVVPDLQHILQLVPPTHPPLRSGDVEQVLTPCICLSYWLIVSSPEILSKEPQWPVATGLPEPAKKRQDLGRPAHFMVKCYLVIQRTQHSDTESHNYPGLFPLLDFPIFTPMSHLTENTKVLMSPVPKVSALKMKPRYSLIDTEPKCPSPIWGDRLISAAHIGN